MQARENAVEMLFVGTHYVIVPIGCLAPVWLLVVTNSVANNNTNELFDSSLFFLLMRPSGSARLLCQKRRDYTELNH